MNSVNSSSTALLSAVKKGDYAQTQKLLSEHGLSIDDKWNDYKILIHAVHTRNTKIVELLLSYGCRVKSSRSHSCKTPICYAVNDRNLEMVKILLEAGASITDKDNNVDTPLYMAMKNKFFTAVDLMLSKYNVDNIDVTSIDEIIHFYIACTRNNVNLVKSFIRCGMDVNTCVNIDTESWPGYSPLHFAVEYKCVEVVELLLSYGADYTFLNAKKLSPLHVAYYLESSKEKYQMMDYIIFLHSTNAANPVDSGGMSHFHIACTRHNTEPVKNFLKNGVAVNSHTLHGCYPLHSAVASNCEEIVEILLKYGASVNVKYDNFTPLRIAIGERSFAITKLLLAYGANICAKDEDDCTPIHRAYYGLHDCYDIFHSMMSVHQGKMINVADKRVGLSIFHIACAVDDTSAVENFIQRNVDINASVGLDGEWSGFTGLHFAAMNYHEDVIKVLLKNKVNVNAVDKNGRSAIWLAVDLVITETVICKLNGNLLKNKSSYEEANVTEEEVMNFMFKEVRKIPIVKLLAENWSNLNRPNEEGIPLLFKAYNPDIWEVINNIPNKNFIQSICAKYNSACRKEILGILIKNGIGLYARDGNHNSILHLVASDSESNESLEIARMLLANGCNPNFENKENSTALHLAADNGSIEHAKLFLQYKANPNCTDDCLATPLHYAAGRSSTDDHEIESPHAKIVRLLIDNGADVNVKNIDGYTPVFAAVNHRRTTKELLYLLKANCQVNVCSNDGISPLLLAAKANNPFAVKLLLDYGADINLNCKKECGLLQSICTEYYISNFSDLDSFVETFKVLEMHIEKLRLINYPVSFSDLYYRKMLGATLANRILANNLMIVPAFVGYNNEVDLNLSEEDNYITPMLQAELEKMKNIKIDGYTSLHNILLKNEIQMVKHVKNEIFNEYLEEDTLNVEFQHYGFLLRLKYKQGMERYVLLEPAEESFRQLIGLHLPDLCLDGIFVFLSNEDLKRLADVYV